MKDDLLKDPEKWPTWLDLIVTCFSGDVSRAKEIIPFIDFKDERPRLTEALMHACRGGHVPVVSLLLDAAEKQGLKENDALFQAAIGGQADMVDFLLSRGQTPHQIIHALSGAAFTCEPKTVRKLISVAPKMSKNNSLLTNAVSQDCSLEVLNLFLSISNPKASQSEPLRVAAYRKNIALFNALYPLSKPFVALREMIALGAEKEDTQLLVDRIKTEKQKKILSSVIETSSQGNKKISAPKRSL